MSARTCDILTYTLVGGDATSQHTFELVRTLSTMGVRTAVHSNYALRDLPPDIQPLARQSSYASYRPEADLTILQYPLWFPLAERFRQAPGARLFWYHGVTPPEHWPVAQERDLLRTSQVRTELANHAHLAVAASPFTAAELQGHSDFPCERTRVIPLGVDVAAFAAKPSERVLAALRSKWRLDNKRVLLYVGRVAGNKRIDLLLDALARLGGAHADVHLLVVGDVTAGVATQVLATHLRRRTRKLGLADRVTLTGRVPDVTPYYHLADVFVLPSEHEGFGVPLVEAMASGTPVLASASGAMPWLLGADGTDPKAAGMVFTPGDAEELAARLEVALTDRELHTALEARGRRRAQAFDLQPFRAHAALVIAEALTMHDAGETLLASEGQQSLLEAQADTIVRDFVVTSRLPLVGERIAQARTLATVHFKEAYFDRVMEQQVSFNRAFARAVSRLEQRVNETTSSVDEKAARP